MISTARTATAVIALCLAFGLAGCAGSADTAKPVETTAQESTAPTPEVTEEGPSVAATTNAIAEREAFFVAQGGAPDPSKPLVAVTPEQKDFVAQQRAYVTAQGGQVDERYDSIILALALDACETSILNAHEVSESVFSTHVATSPLVAQLVPADAPDDERMTAERNVMSIAVFGTTFLCPEDAPQWQQAAKTNYGE